MRIAAVLIFLISVISCKEKVAPFDSCADNHEETFTPCVTEKSISTEKCIIKQAVSTQSGKEVERWIYFHDGTNYTRIDYYSLQTDPNPTVPNNTALLTFDSQGRINVFDLMDITSPNQVLRTTYSYDNIKIAISVDVVQPKASHLIDLDELYLINAKDSLYVIPDDFKAEHGLQEYKNGNMIRQAFVSTVINDPSKATCVIDGNKYLFASKFYFDDRNNVLKDFATRFTYDGRQGGMSYYDQFFFETNHNNVIAATSFDGTNYRTSTQCYNLLVKPSGTRILKDWIFGEKKITYLYDCE